MKAIFRREVNAYFSTMPGYMFMGVFLLISGYLFTQNSLIGGYANLTAILSGILFVTLLITPLLTMRLLAEEKKNRTDRLLLTSPVTITAIVLGKFFAACFVFFVTLLITAVYPVIMAIFGNPYIGEILLGYLGFLLIGGCLVAVGMFISALSENQLTAAVSTIGLLLLIRLMEMVVPQIKKGILHTVLSGVSLFSHFAPFKTGILSIASVLYFISFMLVFLYFTGYIIQKRRRAKG